LLQENCANTIDDNYELFPDINAEAQIFAREKTIQRQKIMIMVDNATTHTTKEYTISDKNNTLERKWRRDSSRMFPFKWKK
jgi:hypothetical protein